MKPGTAVNTDIQSVGDGSNSNRPATSPYGAGMNMYKAGEDHFPMPEDEYVNPPAQKEAELTIPPGL